MFGWQGLLYLISAPSAMAGRPRFCKQIWQATCQELKISSRTQSNLTCLNVFKHMLLLYLQCVLNHMRYVCCVSCDVCDVCCACALCGVYCVLGSVCCV